MPLLASNAAVNPLPAEVPQRKALDIIPLSRFKAPLEPAAMPIAATMVA
jgi:hypothetical protein